MWCIVLSCMMLLASQCGGHGELDVMAWVGTIRGRLINDTVPYKQFLGIPYGKVDEKDPFGPAEYHPHFEIPYSAYSALPICPQFIDKPEGNIHCLHLNIYTPENATFGSNIPVMVYIHDGFFIQGDCNSIPSLTPLYFIQRNVILVTLNYRLGPYGFLCLPELGYSNQGLKDIVLALEWITDNIDSFGGSRKYMLLFGHGTGSVLVELLMLYSEDNVFNKFILQSGQIASPALANEVADEAFVTAAAQKLGIDTKELKMKDIMKKMSTVDRDILINATLSDRYKPCVDGTFIKKAPGKVNMSNINIFVGTTDKDTLYFYDKMNGTFLKDKNIFNYDIKQLLDKGFINLPGDAVDKVKNFYLKGDEKVNIIDFASDFIFNYPVARSVRYYLENNATVYRYVFSHRGVNWMKQLVPVSYGHDMLSYLGDLDDLYVAGMMADMWSQLPEYANPTIWSETSINELNSWPAVTKEMPKYMNISFISNFSIHEGPYINRMAFWDQFYDEYGKYSKGFNFEEEYTKHILNAIK